MSEVYRRSLGYPVDEDALRRELDNGTVSGYDTTNEHEHSAPRNRADVERDIMHLRVQEELLDLELQFHLFEEQMAELALEHPIYTGHVGRLLTDRLDALAAFGHEVDPEMYIEAQELADEIVGANPDKNAEELTEIIETMVGMIQAQARHRQLAAAA